MIYTRILLLLAAALLPVAAVAQEDHEATLFDHPVTVQRVPPKSTGDLMGEIECSYYPDIMVRETRTDTPNPGNATIAHIPAAAPRPACSDVPAQGVELKPNGYGLIGKKGPYLAFGVVDPNGAEDFKIIDAVTGRQIFADSRRWTGFRSVAVENGALHIRYTRAINAPCSIVEDGAGCWANLVRSGAIPRVMAQTPPPVEACASAYRKEKVPVPANAPSMVFYDVDVTLDRAGQERVNSRGPVQCEAVP